MFIADPAPGLRGELRVFVPPLQEAVDIKQEPHQV
jgi:hypothetical protein